MLKDMKYQIKRKLFLSDNDNSPERRNKQSTKQDVEKKKLPSIPTPDLDEYMNRSVAKQKSDAIGSAVLQSYGPYFMEYTLLAEYNLLHKQPIPGMYVLPAAKTPLIWYGVLFIHHGMYEEGVFKFIMMIPDNFPDGDCPVVKFVPAVYHPMINFETGEVDVKRAFPSWRRTVNHLWQVLLFARRLFYRIESLNAINKEAAELYNNDNEAYRLKVVENISSCSEQLYNNIDDDPHSIRFTQWIPEKHGNIKNTMLNCKEHTDSTSRNAQTSGLSWVKKGSVQIFSKPEDKT